MIHELLWLPEITHQAGALLRASKNSVSVMVTSRGGPIAPRIRGVARGTEVGCAIALTTPVVGARPDETRVDAMAKHRRRAFRATLARRDDALARRLVIVGDHIAVHAQVGSAPLFFGSMRMCPTRARSRAK